MVWWIAIAMHSQASMSSQTSISAASGGAPRCPRCGYDQSGVTRWELQCPLESRCSECGLDFLWRDVLNPRFTLPTWCVEYGPPLGVPWRTIRTLLLMLRPERFWSAVQMHHEVRRWRIVGMFMLVLIAGGWLFFAVSAGVTTWLAVRQSATIAARSTPPWLEGVKAAAMPFWFSTPTVYGGMPRQAISRFQPVRIMTAGWRAVRYGAEPLGLSDRVNGIAERACLVICTLIMCPFGFVLLPVSRRMAKVRWAHVHRIALYSFTFILPAVALDIYDQLVVTPYQWRGEMCAIMLFGSVALLVQWWAMATRQYLRMQHGWLVGIYVVAFGYLSQYFVFQSIDLALALAR
jgi:hypothetical protein